MQSEKYPTARLSDYVPVREWVAEKGGDVFATYAAFEWFLRSHREELLASGQFLIRKGPGGSLCGPHLEDVVLEILHRESTEQVAAA